MSAGPITLDFEHGCSWLYVVWAMRPSDIQLVALCSTEAKADEYMIVGSHLYPGAVLTFERVPVDHLFGSIDLKAVVSRATHRGGKPQRIHKVAPPHPAPPSAGTSSDLKD